MKRPAADRNARFESNPDEYEALCMDGVGLSGESMEFFAAGRLAHLRAWWSANRSAEPRTVVDYGCGIGNGTALLPDLFPRSRIVGIDPSISYIDDAQRRFGSDRLAFATLEAFTRDHPHASDRVDLIYTNGVVHHVDPGDRAEFFERSAALLAPDGVYALFENNPLNPGTRWVMARIEFDRGAVPVPHWQAARALRAVGLRIADTRHLFFFPRFLRFLRPLEPHLIRLPLGAQYAVIGCRS